MCIDPKKAVIRGSSRWRKKRRSTNHEHCDLSLMPLNAPLNVQVPCPCLHKDLRTVYNTTISRPYLFFTFLCHINISV
ncbi:unnamed protein product [Bursaphelenchus xylophilus]|uniref:(pine wood nematode) hypothetical protein n=1 Tax=Bursaphelenchus xylophilus TaxID=6326 RepID=A0A1I7S7N5_BURXY|nr:unnamed protein product [Bursaphelenchus xylophilus]CAG9112029.1 unnamed protein product [Bursaphelenchus xylophilus]